MKRKLQLNSFFDDFRTQRMVSMLQPLGKRRRFEKVSYLLLNSDYITQENTENNEQQQEYIIIDSNVQQNENIRTKRSKKSKMVKEDVEKIKKVFNYCETQNQISEIGKISITEAQYCLHLQNIKQPLSVIQKFFKDNQQVDGLVIYFSGTLTQDGQMAFEIENRVSFINIDHIIKEWKIYLDGFKYTKHLMLIIESPNAVKFQNNFQKRELKLDYFNISILMSDRESRYYYPERYFELIRNDISDYQQNQVWKINDYAYCSEFTAALCEYLLNSPPERILLLDQLKKQFYTSKYSIQPGFFGFSMKNYLDFGWFLDVDYEKMLQRSQINYFGIQKNDYNLTMEQISEKQDKILYRGFNFIGLIEDDVTNRLLKINQKTVKKTKRGSKQNIKNLLSLDLQNQIEETKINEDNPDEQEQDDDDDEEEEKQNQEKNEIIITAYQEMYKFTQTSDLNKITRHLNGLQEYSNKALYFGQWLQNKPNGVGVAVYQNGDRYEGQFLEGKQSGYGYLFRKTNVFAGYFHNNMFFNKGIVIWHSENFNEAFVGNFNDRNGYGSYLKQNSQARSLGIISDQHTFQETNDDHEIIKEIADEEDKFDSARQPSWYQKPFQDNRIDYKCTFKKQYEEHQQKQQEIKKKSEDAIKKLFFSEFDQKNESPSSNQMQQNNEPEEPFIQDITKLPQYDELKDDLNQLNPDLESTNIEPSYVEFLVKHAVCKVELKEEELVEMKQKTEEMSKEIEDLLDLFDQTSLGTQDQTPIINHQRTIISFSQMKEEQKQNENAGLNQQTNNTLPQLQAQKSIQKRDTLIPLVALSKVYSQHQNVELHVSDKMIEQDVTQKCKKSLLQVGLTQDTQYLKIKIQDDEKQNFDNQILNQDNKEEFITEFKKNAAMAHGCSPSDIIIVGLSKGSIEIEYKLQDQSIHFNNNQKAIQYFRENCNYKEAQLKLHSLLEHATLTPQDCDIRFNCEWNTQKLAYRGFIRFKQDEDEYKQQRYYLPVGWKGYGLNISKYKDLEWLGNYGKRTGYDEKKQWIVLYHGTSFQGLKGIPKEGLKSGSQHKYAGAKCRITGKLIGHSKIAVYLTDNVDEAGKYSTPFEMCGKYFKMVFQCRVNPNVVKSPQNKPEYYIVEESDQPQKNIRPYRILLKKLNEQEIGEFEKKKKEIEQKINNPNEIQYEMKKIIQEEVEPEDIFDIANFQREECKSSKDNDSSSDQESNKNKNN